MISLHDIKQLEDLVIKYSSEEELDDLLDTLPIDIDYDKYATILLFIYESLLKEKSHLPFDIIKMNVLSGNIK